MIIIPAIDLMGGRCVRLRQGEFDRSTVFSSDPAATALSFERAGASCLHVVDLDGARLGAPRHSKVIEKIRRSTRMVMEVGGGLRRARDVENLFSMGVDRAVVGSMAVENPKEYAGLLERFGGRIVTAVDLRGGMVATRGWTKTCGNLSAEKTVARLARMGARWILMTDIGRDGMLSGPNTALYRKILRLGVVSGEKCRPTGGCCRPPSIRLIASGGIGNIADLKALASSGLDAAVVGRALYEKRLRLCDALKLETR